LGIPIVDAFLRLVLAVFASLAQRTIQLGDLCWSSGSTLSHAGGRQDFLTGGVALLMLNLPNERLFACLGTIWGR
jgi:hypothetical protein